MLILAPDIPLPLLSTMLDTLFSSFQPPTISLLSAPVLTTMAAALRSSLVIDIGWAETTVTAVYEYREVFCRRTVRASKLLGREMLKLLGEAIRSQSSQDDTPNNKLISFEECEEVVTRMAWCRPSATSGLASVSGDLSSALEELQINEKDGAVSISLRSTQPPMRLNLPFSSLAEPCENALFAKDVRPGYVDDEELPLHLLVYRALLQLPVDVRSVCMSRLIFTGGASNIPGLKSRILGDVQGLIDARGWNPVQGEVVADIRSRQRNLAKESSVSAISTDGEDALSEADIPAKPAAFRGQEPDPIESQLRREKNKTSRPSVHGTLRAVDSMGAWSGGSLISQLRVPLVSVVEKEQWLQYGLAGASKAKEVVPAKQRQSMGPAGLRAVAGEQTGWTLGPWG
jgi:actin-related protein